MAKPPLCIELTRIDKGHRELNAITLFDRNQVLEAVLTVDGQDIAFGGYCPENILLKQYQEQT